MHLDLQNIWLLPWGVICQVILTMVLLVVWFIFSLPLSLLIKDLYDLKRVFPRNQNIKLLLVT